MIEKPDLKLSRRLYDRYFTKTTNGFFVECGANTGIHRSIGYWFEHKHNWKGINIECNPHCFKLLKRNRPNCLNLDVALSNENNNSIFRFPVDGPRKELGGGGSIVANYWKDESRPIKECKINTITYQRLIETNAVEHIDLFVLDVEGNEINALKGMGNSKVIPKVFCIETNKSSKEIISKILKPLKYKIDCKDSSNTYFVID
jgi:FkbM family methyltransferase